MYFKELPNVQYPSPLSDRGSDRDYVTIKNIFRRAKLRDDLVSELTAFDDYEVREGQRPDIVANDYYENSELDWLVLICNNITNVRDQWPLSDQELYNFAVEKYGNEINDIAFYESTEVRDDMNRLIYPAGIVVDSDFEIIDPDDATSILRPIRSVTYYEHEVRKNDEKRTITLLKPDFVTQALIDLREELTYGRSSQYVDSKTIRSENIRLKSYD